MREPDTRSGQKPDAMKGTLTARDLTAGASYAIYRWDSVAEAFTCKDLDIAEHLNPTSPTLSLGDPLIASLASGNVLYPPPPVDPRGPPFGSLAPLSLTRRHPRVSEDEVYRLCGHVRVRRRDNLPERRHNLLPRDQGVIYSQNNGPPPRARARRPKTKNASRQVFYRFY